jgi:hypothetical protein
MTRTDETPQAAPLCLTCAGRQSWTGSDSSRSFDSSSSSTASSDTIGGGGQSGGGGASGGWIAAAPIAAAGTTADADNIPSQTGELSAEEVSVFDEIADFDKDSSKENLYDS